MGNQVQFEWAMFMMADLDFGSIEDFVLNNDYGIQMFSVVCQKHQINVCFD